MPRQQTLQATVDWSFGLLTQAERDALTRLSVFAGGFELEAAEAICASADVDALDVMDLLGSLVDKSLVVADRGGESVRYRLLETIRQYSAQELVRAAGEEEAMRVRDRHADYYLKLAEETAPALTGPHQGRYLRRLDSEWDNLRAAFAHLRADERSGDVLRLAVAVGRFVLSRGHADVIPYLARARVARRCEAETGTCQTRAGRSARQRAPGLGAADHAVAAQGPGCSCPARGGTQSERSSSPGERQRRGGSARARHTAGRRLHRRRRRAMRRLSAESVAVARSTGDTQLIGELLSFTGLRHVRRRGAADRTRRRWQISALPGTCFSPRTSCTACRASIWSPGGRLRPCAGLEQAIELVEELGDEVFLFGFRSDFGVMLLITGEHERAAPLLRQCLLVARRTGVLLDVSQLIFGSACIAAWQGRHELAAKLFGAADTDVARGNGRRQHPADRAGAATDGPGAGKAARGDG